MFYMRSRVKIVGNLFPNFTYSCFKNCILNVRKLSSLTETEINHNLDSQCTEFSHTPVMVQEILKALRPENKKVFIDMTFGAGGHSRQMLNAADIKLYCLDRDPVAYERAEELAKNSNGQIIPLLGKFSELESLLDERGVKRNSVDGILIDAGCSSMQMDDPNRGFSLSKNGPLDMRMDKDRYPDQPTASDVLSALDVPSLVKILKTYGEEKHARKIAQAIIDAQYLLKNIRTTHELADLVKCTLGCVERFDLLQRPSHVATKVFQALRIFVNDELNELNYGLELAHAYLKPGGRFAALSFHSLEDRIIKRHILGINMDEPVSKSLSQKYRNASLWHVHAEVEKLYSNKWTSLYKNVIKPTEEEINLNPRSRSAKLRAAVKN